MADPNLKISIQTDADVAAAKKAEEALHGVIDAAKKADDAAQKIDIPAPLPGADAAEKKIEDIGKEADETAKKIDKITVDDILPGLSATKDRLNKLPGATPPPLPGATPTPLPTGSAPGVGDIAAGNIAAELLVANFRSIIELSRDFAVKLSDGANRAVELANEISGLDEAARRARVDGLGPLGELIERNSPALLRFQQESQAVRDKLDEVWIAAGARLVPALNELNSELLSLQGVDLGKLLGDTAGGAAASVADLVGGVRNLNAESGAGAAAVGGFGQALTAAAPGGRLLGDALGYLTQRGREANEQIGSYQNTTLFQLASQLERMAALEKNLADVQKRAAEAALPDTERLAVLREKLGEAMLRASTLQGASADKAAAEAVTLQQQVSTLETKVAKEEAIVAARTAATEKAAQERDMLELGKTFLEGWDALEKDRAAAKQQTLSQTRDELELIRERGQTALAEMRAQGASESDLQRQRMANAEERRQKELEIAKIQGNAAQKAALHDEERKQERAQLAEIEAKEAEAAEKRLGTEKAITAEINAQADARGRASAPLQQSPLGPSAMNAPVDLLAPAKPIGLGQELAAKGSEAFGTEGSRPSQPEGKKIAEAGESAQDAIRAAGEDAAKAIEEAGVAAAEAVKTSGQKTGDVLAKSATSAADLVTKSGEEAAAAISATGEIIVEKMQMIIANAQTLTARIEALEARTT